jgi:putative tryptophan/tyrosine transport system substrate-binding protein
VRRREFIAILGTAAASWPFAARAQQTPMPVIGLLDSRSPEVMVDRLRGFRQGLKETGYVEGDNVTIVYRWAENQFDRLPELAAELVRRRVTVIVPTAGPAVVFAAKMATTMIPIVFGVAGDPVRLGLVPSLARPRGNLTGVAFLTAELVSKQLGLLHDLVPQAARVATFVNPANVAYTESTLRDADATARVKGLQIQVHRAISSEEIDASFDTLARERPDALFVSNDAFFHSRRVQFVQLAAHHRIPAIYTERQFPEIGGLLSYGTSIVDVYRQMGAYTGRILNGEKPANLPVVQSTKLDFVINNQTARILRLSVPPSLLAAADEVIE